MNINSRKRMLLLVSQAGFLEDLQTSVGKTWEGLKDFFSQKHAPEETKKVEEKLSPIISDQLKPKTPSTKTKTKTRDSQEDLILQEIKKLMEESEESDQELPKIKENTEDFKTSELGSGLSSPAALRALYDANKKWSKRSKKYDGIMGDVSHQKRLSDHNNGNAVDITHDPGNGPSGDEIASMALQDPRTKYIIWNRKITKPGQYTKDYDGPNPHTSHVHISIKDEMRGDSSPWLWGK